MLGHQNGQKYRKLEFSALMRDMIELVVDRRSIRLCNVRMFSLELN